MSGVLRDGIPTPSDGETEESGVVWRERYTQECVPPLRTTTTDRKNEVTLVTFTL